MLHQALGFYADLRSMQCAAELAVVREVGLGQQQSHWTTAKLVEQPCKSKCALHAVERCALPVARWHLTPTNNSTCLADDIQWPNADVAGCKLIVQSAGHQLIVHKSPLKLLQQVLC